MNYAKTALLLAAMTAFFLSVGFMLGGQAGLLLALGVALAMNFFAYWNSDKVLLKMYKAQPLTNGEIYEMVKELAVVAKMPMPKVYALDVTQPNAFATGRNPENAAVAVTRGIVNILDERELRGVLAHELAHIKNRDTLIMTITATIAGAIGMLANFALFFGNNRNNSNPVATIALMILAPLAATLVQMAISRTREYAADRMGAEICGDPLALASALNKLERGASRIDNHAAENNPATAHLFIINPLHAKKVDNLFTTHPRTQNRIAALQQLAASMGVTEPAASVAASSISNQKRGPWG